MCANIVFDCILNHLQFKAMNGSQRIVCSGGFMVALCLVISLEIVLQNRPTVPFQTRLWEMGLLLTLLCCVCGVNRVHLTTSYAVAQNPVINAPALIVIPSFPQKVSS